MHAGETTDDGLITLEHIECNAACDYAPVVMVNWEFFDNQTPSSATDLVAALRSGQTVAPTRGRCCAASARPHASWPASVRTPRTAPDRAHPRWPGCWRPARNHAGKVRVTPGQVPHATEGTHADPVLSRFWDAPQPWTLDTYLAHDGYLGLRTALAMTPDQVVAEVKESGLRGRGGAGFPTGTKWSFIDRTSPKPKYLVINADESEPGTCKDMPLLLTTPHFLVEGAIIAAYAIGARHAFIYLRGEVLPVLRPGADRRRRGLHRGVPRHRYPRLRFRPGPHRARRAGAYICGEETALLDSWRAAAASPGCVRRSRPSPASTPAPRWSTTSSPSPACRRSWSTGGLVQVDGHREVAWFHALLTVRARDPSGPVRSATGHHAARVADLRRRGARRA